MNEQGHIERNFHILNEDRFIMEKISLPIEPQEGETIHDAINRVRNTIIENFKAAYPKVYTHLNFDEVRQMEDVVFKDGSKIKDYALHKTEPIKPSKYDEFYSFPSAEKINKGTIEEQIQACNTIDELITFELVAKMNPKLLETYSKQVAKLAPIK